jgi:hypothetical protein
MRLDKSITVSDILTVLIIGGTSISLMFNISGRVDLNKQSVDTVAGDLVEHKRLEAASLTEVKQEIKSLRAESKQDFILVNQKLDRNYRR